MSLLNCLNSTKRESNEASDGDKIQASCLTMCPLDEARLRIDERMVHVLERVGPEWRLVKSYSRSAADANMVVPSHLRPYHTLRETIIHLLFEVTKRSDVPATVVYDFVNDRLRSVRQDMTIQRLGRRQCAELLEPMIRFYVYFGHWLHGLPAKDFDPVLHRKYLLECLKWFLSCYDKANLSDINDVNDDLGNMMESLTLNGHHLPCDRVLVESLYILCNLDNVHPLHRFVGLPQHLKQHPTLRLTYRIAIANLRGNFVLVTKLLSQLCPLTYCALCQYLPELQRRAVHVLSYAYSCKTLSVPVTVVRRWLAVASDGEATDITLHYGMTVDDTDVRFCRAQLKTDVAMHQPKIQLLHQGSLNLNLHHVLTYTTCY